MSPDPQVAPALSPTRNLHTEEAPTRESWPELPAGSAVDSLNYEELLQAYQRMAEKNRRTEQALATAAHELKTPLAIMAGYVDVLLRQKAGALNERQLAILEDLQANCARLHEFAHEFLTYSALETGALSMKFECGDLNACLSEVYEFWLSRFQAKGVAFYFPKNETLESFPFDYHKVQRIVANLLENALKFTPRGGTVWLTAEPHFWERRTRQETGLKEERRQVGTQGVNAMRVSVADTGAGIAAEYHQEIFDDFLKLPVAEAESDGLGMGLAIVRRLVLAHGGKIWVESEPGAGSKFCFLLPQRPA